MDVEVVLNAHAIIGESPTWSPAERALYWIDVKEPALHRYDLKNQASRSWRVTSDLGAFALLDGNAALLALRQGIHRLEFASGSLELLAPPPFDPRLFRFNEGYCDHSGRFWVGVMFDPIDGSPPPRRSALHSYTLDGGLRRENDEAELHNGMALSVDGRRFEAKSPGGRQNTHANCYPDCASSEVSRCRCRAFLSPTFKRNLIVGLNVRS